MLISNITRKKWLLVGIFISLFVTLRLFLDTNTFVFNLKQHELFCHFEKLKECLPDISDNEPSYEKRNIFFLETSCNTFLNKKIFIKARQACAVESAARTNPNMDVYLLYASPGIFKDDNSESDRFLKVLMSYSNIKILHFNIERFIKNTPVESLWTTGKIQQSVYPMAHTSDVLRLLTLWKYGGIYLDLDVIVIKGITSLPPNFAGAESESIVANGVMGFSNSGKGHSYVNACMHDVKNNYKGDDWAYNGPRLITRMISNLCPHSPVETIIDSGQCQDFTIFPTFAFYLIPFPKWEWFFDKNLTETMSYHAKEDSYLIHMWNKLSGNTKIFINDTDVPYLYIAKEFCPKVVKECDEYF